MDATQRRAEILSRFEHARQPVKGGVLAKELSVSRQVIVQDVALLRAKGHPILATPDGYVLPAAAPSPCARVAACIHTGFERMREELYAVVDAGAVVEDIVVSHPVYGEFRAMLMLASRRQVDDFVENPGWQEASPLSVLTDGLHLHTLTAPDERTLDVAFSELERRGFLAPDE
ncbi:3H domain-containing protein [Beduinella massiliensis]|uniref:3H domain-containing protein n=1 Tax=Beduinella massiliensis TaxID=1852363 RepID=UPI000C85BE70